MSIESAIEELAPHFGNRLSRAAAILEQHGRDEAWHTPRSPDAVIWPHTTDEVSLVARTCHAHGCPIVAWGAGTSLEGHVIPVQGGVTLDFGEMSAVLAVHQEDMDCIVQPGITRKRLNEELRETGLFFPIDPGADASIGGMTGTRASGTSAVRYGTMREVVLGLEVVLSDGRVIRTGTRAKKSSAGYDLTKIFVGSEGTLGIITEITLRLYGVPEATSAAICTFPTTRDAVNTAIQTIQMGIPIARIEYLDSVSIKTVNRHSGYDMSESPTLFMEFHGSDAGVAEQAEMVAEIASDNEGSGFEWTIKAEERNRLWSARHNFAYAVGQQHPGKRLLATDACVPISRLADCIDAYEKDTADSRLFSCVVGHVGDGNFHGTLVLDPDDPEDVAEAQRLTDRLTEHTLSMGGTISGEHGVGFGKKKFMVREHGEDAWALMGDIKRTFDPTGILNPGKMLPGN
ncbi:MAG: FAD-linked oxidase C-terminal domain-containing protein [Pseudomonadota bacterium]